MAVPDLDLPSPPDILRQGPFREGSFGTHLRDERTAALLGRALGIAVTICFTTGYISHLHQHPPAWLDMPSRPVRGYQLTQGLHVVTGLAMIPILLAKLWIVWPKLFAWPPARTMLHALERLSLLALVGGALFEVTSGLINITQWYPWSFFFPRTHYLVAWLLVGAVLVHIGVKLPAIRRGLARDETTAADDRAAPDGSFSRRGLLIATGAAVVGVTLTTVGQTLRPLQRLALLAPRRPNIGPQGLPVNRTSEQAQVARLAQDPAWAVQIVGARTVALTLAQLRELPQHASVLPIACVEGWSSTAHWSGVRLRDLLALVDAPAGASVRVRSLEEKGLYRASTLKHHQATDALTLLALDLNGEPLHLEHGFPARLIAPNRPGVLQTKWISRIEVQA